MFVPKKGKQNESLTTSMYPVGSLKDRGTPIRKKNGGGMGHTHIGLFDDVLDTLRPSFPGTIVMPPILMGNMAGQ
jgi:hypothetical protein